MARDETIKLSLIDGVTRTMGAIRDSVSGVGAALVKLNQGAELAQKGFNAIGTAAASVGNAVQGAADLESALASLQAVTSASAEEFATLREAAIGASERTRFTAIEAANGLAELARAGLSATEAINVLNPALAIAQGNNISVAQSSELLTTTIKQFGASMGEAARFADVLQATADGTATSVEQIGNAMSYVAPLARLAGTSIEQTSAIIGALADQGFRGERAGTALRNVFSALSDPASKFSKALDAAGIQSRDFATVIEQLGKKGDGAKKILLALDSEARPAILSLVNDGGGAIGELAKKLEDAQGAAERTSAILGDTFNGAVARLQNSVTNLRNEFLSPILQPLAREAELLAEKLNSLADSPQFARVRQQFESFATSAIKAVGDLVENADLEQWAANISAFTEGAKQAFDALVVVVEATADTIRGIAGAIDAMREAGRQIQDTFGDAETSVRGLNSAAGGSIGTLLRFGAATESAAESAADAADSTRQFALGADLFATDADAAGAAASNLADEMLQVPPAAKLTYKAIFDAGDAAKKSAASIDELRERLAAVRDQLNAAAPGSPQFQQLARDAAELERQIAEATKQIDAAAGATDKLAAGSDRAAGSMRNFAGAARDAGDAAEDVASSNSQVDQSFSRIGKQAAAAKISLGDYSDSLIELALAQQSQARSGKEIIQVWAEIKTRFELANQRIKDAIALAERQNMVLDDEARIRKELERQYGTDSRLLEQLVQLKLKENNERQRAIELSERENEQIERRNAAQAGALNFGGRSADAGTAVGGRGGDASGSGRGDAAPQIVVNVQGAPTDAAGWRDLVSRFIAPELERLQRLSR